MAGDTIDGMQDNPRPPSRERDPLVRAIWIALTVAVVTGGIQLGAHLALQSVAVTGLPPITVR